MPARVVVEAYFGEVRGELYFVCESGGCEEELEIEGELVECEFSGMPAVRVILRYVVRAFVV